MTTAVAVKTKKTVRVYKSSQVNKLAKLFRQALLLLLLFSLSFFIKVYLQTTVNENNIKANNLTLTLAKQKEVNEELLLKANLLKAPGRIYSIATNELKMQKPEQVKYLIMPIIKVQRQKVKTQALASRPLSRVYIVK